jgi:DNA-binding MarR family transcriptional regulator
MARAWQTFWGEEAHEAGMAQKPKGVRATVMWHLVSGGVDGSPVHLLFVASRCADKMLANALRSSGLTPRQYAVLVTVAQHQPVTQAGIANRIGVTRATVAGFLSRLTDEGLLSGKDLGTRYIRLTDAGRRAINVTNAIATQVDNRMVAAVPARRRGQFVADLAVLVQSHRAALTGGA